MRSWGASLSNGRRVGPWEGLDVNVVCLVGRVVEDPTRMDDRDRIELRVAVSRRLRGGLPQPGVVQLVVAVRASGLLERAPTPRPCCAA